MKKKIKKIEHWYTECNGWFDFQKTYELAVNESRDGDILVETGTANGKSVAYLSVEALNSGKDLKIFTIDNTTDEAQLAWVNKILERMSNVTYLHADSIITAKDFKDESCRMVYLDSCHDLEFVLMELRAWWPKVITGGIFAGHDFANSFPSVVEAVTIFAKENKLKIIDCGNTWMIRK